MSKELLILNYAERGIATSAEFQAAKETALANAALIGAVRNAEAQNEAVAAQAELKALISGVEKARKAAKEPFLEFGRQIDEKARQITADISAEHLRVTNQIQLYQEEQRAIAAAEEKKRQEELRRVEEENRRKLYEAEQAARKAAEDARREQERIAAEAREKERIAAEAARKEAERIAAEAAKERNAARRAEMEAAAAAAAEKARIEAEKRKAELEAQQIAAALKAVEDAKAAAAAVEAAEAEARKAVAAVGPAVVAQTARGQVVKTEIQVEVTDIHLLYRGHPNCVNLTPRLQEIKDLYAMGYKDIKGVRFTEVTKSTTRGRVQPMIEV